MKKLLIIKYAELNTKKGNIGLFLKALKNNIQDKLSNINHEIIYDKGRMFIYTEEENFDSILNVLINTFGILKVNIGYEIDDIELSNLDKELLNVIKNISFNTFKVEVKRSNKNYPLNSMELSKHFGATILKNIDNIKVDVQSPEVLINIEIRNNKAYIYHNSYKGLGGYPLGVAGKGLLMLSGGIDSPVAGYLAMKRGIKLEAIYFESPPHTSNEAKEKVLSLARILSSYGTDIKVHIVPFTDIQEAILRNIPKDYLITIMRRMMYRISDNIARHNRCKVLINGESISQVASQTLSSMVVINNVAKMPVIRPVACFDKLEIIELANKIGTYETSILPYEDCCTIFVPEHPVIDPVLSKCEEYEKLIPYEELIKEAIANTKIEKVNNKNNLKYEDIL